MKRFGGFLFVLTLLSLLVLTGCTQPPQGVLQESSQNFPDAVNIDFSKFTDAERSQLATNLPEYDVSTIFSSTFSKPVQYSSLTRKCEIDKRRQ